MMHRYSYLLAVVLTAWSVCLSQVKNTRVTNDDGSGYGEVSLASVHDSLGVLHLAAAVAAQRGGVENAGQYASLYYSSDSGASWIGQYDVPGNQSYTHAGTTSKDNNDPGCAIDAQRGYVYVSYFSQTDTRRVVRVARFSDWGVTNDSVTYQINPPLPPTDSGRLDFPIIAIDNSPLSTERGTVYVGFNWICKPPPFLALVVHCLVFEQK
jgi:hypothetical protein